MTSLLIMVDLFQSFIQALANPWVFVHFLLWAVGYLLLFRITLLSDKEGEPITKARLSVIIPQGRMQPAGRRAYDARDDRRARRYSFENRPRTLPAAYLRLLKADPEAWAFFQAQPPGYRRTVVWWT